MSQLIMRFISIILCICVTHVNALNIFAFDKIENIIEEFITSEEGESEEVTQNKLNTTMIFDKHMQNEEQSHQKFTLQSRDNAKIIALNKITAKSLELIMPVTSSQYFGNIEIKLHKCIKNLNPYFLDNIALLTVTENKVEEDQILVFQGWMSSANISISTLEHPVYEVFVKECM